MSASNVQPIWSPETGIVDLEGSPAALGASEIPGIKAIWTEQRGRLKGSKHLSDFTERLSREWAIETGIIENLYEIERGVTQTLIERGFQAELLGHGTTNKPRDYVIQLLRDQKDALDGVFDFVKGDRPLTTSYVKELHAALLRSQHLTEGVDSQGRSVEIPLIKGDWKTFANSPSRDGVIFSYCPPEQVASEMDRLIQLHRDHEDAGVPSEVQAAWLHHRFTQIHPFQDGNGRVARAIASLVLVKDGLFPLVVTRDDKASYLDALEMADEGNLKPLVDLIAKLQITQFRKATSISEAILVQDDVDAALSGLLKAADKIARDKLAELRGVFGLAHKLEQSIEERLAALRPSLLKGLKRADPNATVFVTKSTNETEHFFRAQIFENAKHHLDYFADFAEYRSWVAINVFWYRRAKIVFAIHGIGRPFNGSLICAPFLDLRDTDEEQHTQSTTVPLSDEGFVFFYNENEDRLLERFLPWRERALNVAIKELTRNL
ncbi:MAG TPA: Fic family protein [Allosphingosinicella sp.]|jgi:Fic family protein|nr:Fic family protein [Allosphingosinicella sp.]